MHLITEQLNQLSIVYSFYLLHCLIESSPPYLKELASSMLVSLDWRDCRTLAKLPRSNEATGWVTKGRAAQPAYAGLANEVLPLSQAMVWSVHTAPSYTVAI